MLKTRTRAKPATDAIALVEHYAKIMLSASMQVSHRTLNFMWVWFAHNFWCFENVIVLPFQWFCSISSSCRWNQISFREICKFTHTKFGDYGQWRRTYTVYGFTNLVFIFQINFRLLFVSLSHKHTHTYAGMPVITNYIL